MAPSFDFFPFPPGGAAFFAVPRRGGGFAKAAAFAMFLQAIHLAGSAGRCAAPARVRRHEHFCAAKISR